MTPFEMAWNLLKSKEGRSIEGIHDGPPWLARGFKTKVPYSVSPNISAHRAQAPEGADYMRMRSETSGNPFVDESGNIIYLTDEEAEEEMAPDPYWHPE